jgi:hypothetical protein
LELLYEVDLWNLLAAKIRKDSSKEVHRLFRGELDVLLADTPLSHPNLYGFKDWTA